MLNSNGMIFPPYLLVSYNSWSPDTESSGTLPVRYPPLPPSSSLPLLPSSSPPLLPSSSPPPPYPPLPFPLLILPMCISWLLLGLRITKDALSDIFPSSNQASFSVEYLQDGSGFVIGIAVGSCSIYHLPYTEYSLVYHPCIIGCQIPLPTGDHLCVGSTGCGLHWVQSQWVPEAKWRTLLRASRMHCSTSLSQPR